MVVFGWLKFGSEAFIVDRNDTERPISGKAMYWHRPDCAILVWPVAYLPFAEAARREWKENRVAPAHFREVTEISTFRPLDDITHAAIRHLYVPVHQSRTELGAGKEARRATGPAVQCDATVINRFHRSYN